jgi:hypothetical protein
VVATQKQEVQMRQQKAIPPQVKKEALMRKLTLPLLSALLLLLAGVGLIQVARGQGPGTQVVAREAQGTDVREILAPEQIDAPQPDIGFIDSPTVVCYQPNAARDACYINWYYMAVDAAPNYLITMTVTIAPMGIVGQVHGFFQTLMHVPYGMFGDGFQVPCGVPGAGGNPRLGNAYSWTIRARDSAGLGAANYGTVYCPAYVP